VVRSDTSSSGGWVAQSSVVSVVASISGYCLVPVISGALGMLLWIWPSRKPPRLSESR
jgi:hypothetical protein